MPEEETETFRKYMLPERTGFHCLTLETHPKPRPGPGEVLVRIKAISLNWRDCAIAKGIYAFPGRACNAPCSDGAGIIESIGEGVQDWQPNDRVAATFIQTHLSGPLLPPDLQSTLAGSLPGLLSEYVLFPPTGLVPLPPHLTFEEGACFPCAGVTAWNALHGGPRPVQAGDVVLLQGTGGVSIFGVQIAKAAGAKVVVTSSKGEKLEEVKRVLGADLGVNYLENGGDWAGEVRRLTGGRGVDHVLDIGGRETLPQSLKALAWNGVVNSIGHMTHMVRSEEEEKEKGEKEKERETAADCLTIDMPYMLRGIIVGSREHFRELLECFESKGLRPVIDRVFEFEEAREAYEYHWTSSRIGKVVIRVP